MLGRLENEEENEDMLRRDKGWLIFLNPEWFWRAMEIEDLMESNQRRPSKFMRANPVYA